MLDTNICRWAIFDISATGFIEGRSGAQLHPQGCGILPFRQRVEAQRERRGLDVLNRRNSSKLWT